MTEKNPKQALLIPADVIAEWLESLDVAEVTKKSYRCGLRSLEEYALENGLDIDALEDAAGGEYVYIDTSSDEY